MQCFSLWYKMRSSMYMRLGGYKKECAREVFKALRYNPMNYKVYAYIVLNIFGAFNKNK